MTYDEAMHCWFGRVNYELQTPEPGDLKLDRMRVLLGRLGQPARTAAHRPRRRQQGQGLDLGHAGGDPAARPAIAPACSRRRTCRRVEERIQVDGEPIAAAELAEPDGGDPGGRRVALAGTTTPLDAG